MGRPFDIRVLSSGDVNNTILSVWLPIEETTEHVSGLEKVFDAFGELPKRKTCKAMQGLLAEGKELIEEKAGEAALICAAQKVEHYEIASYGSLLAWSKLLEESDGKNPWRRRLMKKRRLMIN